MKSAMHLKVFLSLALLAILFSLVVPSASTQDLDFANNVLSPRTVPKNPPPPKPPTSKPKPITIASTVKFVEATIKKLLDKENAGLPPVIDGGVDLTDDPIYPDNAEAKLLKTEAPKSPESDTACAKEECLDSQNCVHMAGRKFVGMWVTCCGEGMFADFHGNCCKKKLTQKKHFCP